MPEFSRLCGAAFFAFFAKWIPPLLANNDPTVTVEVLKPLCRHILLKVNTQHLFKILPGGSTGRESVVVDVLLDAGKIGEHIGLLFSAQPDDNIEFAAGRHEHLNAVQVLAVLLQQSADRWQFLLIQPLPVEDLIALEGFLGIERQHFDLCLSLYDIQQRIDAGADAGIRQDGDIRRLDDEEHEIAHAGGNAVILDLLNAHELPCGAGGFVLFLLFTHDSNLQS